MWFIWALVPPYRRPAHSTKPAVTVLHDKMERFVDGAVRQPDGFVDARESVRKSGGTGEK